MRVQVRVLHPYLLEVGETVAGITGRRANLKRFCIPTLCTCFACEGWGKSGFAGYFFL